MEPLTRKEFFLNAILNGTEAPKPVTREEMYLAQIAANGGGGGGGGGVTMTVVNVSVNDQDQLLLDKNYNEIKAILEAGNLAETFWDNEVGDYNYNLIVAYGSFDDEGTTIYYVKNIASEIFESDSPTGVLTYE